MCVLTQLWWLRDDDIVFLLIDFLCWLSLSSHIRVSWHKSMLRKGGEKKVGEKLDEWSDDRLFMSDAIQIANHIVEYVEKIDRINYGALDKWNWYHRWFGLFTLPISIRLNMMVGIKEVINRELRISWPQVDYLPDPFFFVSSKMI